MTIEFTEDMRAIILAMRAKGYPQVEIAERIGVNHETLRHYCEREGIETKRAPHTRRGRPRYEVSVPPKDQARRR